MTQSIGKIIGLALGVIALLGAIWSGLAYLDLTPAFSMDLKKVERRSLRYAIPLLSAQQRELRITRGQLKLLPQTVETIEDIEAVTDQIKANDELLSDAKQRAIELR